MHHSPQQQLQFCLSKSEIYFQVTEKNLWNFKAEQFFLHQDAPQFPKVSRTL